MLYTWKDIEKQYSKIIFQYIRKGARINTNVRTSGSSCTYHHINLICNNRQRILVFIRNTRHLIVELGVCMEKPGHHDTHLEYLPEDADIHILQRFYPIDFKTGIYADNTKAVEDVQTKHETRINKNRLASNTIQYNKDTILRIIHKKKGFSRIKADEIYAVTKTHYKNACQYVIHIHKNGKERNCVMYFPFKEETL